MDNKFLGIKISTYFTVLVCLVAAFLLWLCVNVSTMLGEQALAFATELMSAL